MALTKTPDEITKMREGGALLSRALAAAVAAVRKGATPQDLDAVAERVIREGGGEPSFLGYKTAPEDPPFPSTLCVSINEEIVHGPGNRTVKLKDGDIVGLDIGCWYQGLCTDMAVTVPVGVVAPKLIELMRVTRESMMAGVKAARVGGVISDISVAIEGYISAKGGSASGGRPHGYGIVRSLVGHGVGHKVHEAPRVPNFVDRRYPKVQIKDGMCLAIEPMVGLGGDWQVETAADGWTILMADGKPGAHFEVTIAVTKSGVEILTHLPV